jgi:VCBS repeat-containing protein/probable HAF family extracellular repeat protein
MPMGINASGIIVGSFSAGGGKSGTHTHGFIYDGSSFTQLDADGAADTAAFGINAAGDIVGTYDTGARAPHQAFVDIGGTLTTLPISGVSAEAHGIDNAGDIVGAYQDSTGTHGFLYAGGGTLTLDDPLASGFTEALGINNAGQIVGDYQDSDGITHGFRYDIASGAYTTVDAPGADDTTVSGINDAGVITGTYDDAAGQHGFVLGPVPAASGTISFADADLSDTHMVSHQGTPVGSTLGSLTAVLDHDSTGGATGQVTWSYAVDNAAIAHLGAGESVIDKFTVTLDDGHGSTVTQEIDVTVQGINDAPVAQAISGSVQEDTGNPVTLTAAFSDADAHDGHSFTVDTTGTRGIVVNNGDGTFSYNANGAFESLAQGATATDTFTYTVDDGHGSTSTATATVTIVGEDDAPTTAPVILTVIAEDSGTRLITQAELLANASDIDSPGLSATALAISAGSGVLTDNGDGTWIYTPALNDDSQVAFSYTVTDGLLGVAASAILDVTPVNDAPVDAVPGAQSVNQNIGLVFSAANNNAISVSDVDADGGIESITLGVQLGTLTLGSTAGLATVSGNGTGSVSLSGTLAALNAALDGTSYVSTGSFNGTDTLTLISNDQGNSGAGSALTDTETVTINVLDTTVPTGGTPDLIVASDSGTSNTDNITDVTSPTFTVALGASVSVGDTVELLLGGASLAHAVTHTINAGEISAGSVSLTVAAGDLGADGAKAISARFADASHSSTTGALLITLDTTVPAISNEKIASASGIQNATLNAGDVVSVTASFGEAVSVSGTPQLALNIGGTVVQANYASGSGTNTVTFTTTIQSGQTDTNGIAIPANALSLNGGTITDIAGNAARLTAAAVSDNASFKVDTTGPSDIVFTFDSVAADLAALTANNQLNAGKKIGTFAQSGDTGTYTYTLSGNGASSFALNGNTGVLTVGAANVTVSGLYALAVTATDLAGNAFTKAIDIFAGSSADDRPNLATLAGSTSTTLVAYGLDGNDNLSGSSLTANAYLVLGSGTGQAESIASTPAVLSGGTGNDVLIGGSGADNIHGGGGTDTIRGNGGTDIFTISNFGAATITDLGAGNTGSTLIVSAGSTVNATATGNFTAVAGTNQGTVAITAGGHNIDMSAAGGTTGYTISNAGNGTGVTLTGSTFADVITAGSGGSTINGGGGADTLTGGSGNDTFLFASKAALDAATVTSGGGSDTLKMTAGATLIDSDFALVSGTFNTLILSGASNVTLDTHAKATGLYAIVTGSGATTISQNGGFITQINAGAMAASATLTLSKGGALGPLSITNLNGNLNAAGSDPYLEVTIGNATDGSISIATGDFSTVISDNNATDVVTVDASQESTTGAADYVVGSAQYIINNLNGYLDASSATGTVTVTGKASQHNTIIGGSGNDTITGGGGFDTLTGNGGADTFRYTLASDSTQSAADTITDFAHGTDKIDLSTITGARLFKATQLASTSASVAADTVAWIQTGGNTLVYVNNTGAAVAASSAAMKITLSGTISLTAVDFSLSATPAGVAGSPIDLALHDQSGGLSVTYAISGVADGWTLNQGIDHHDGTWTVTTSDPSGLAVVTPSGFVGATVLQVDESWTNVDGSAGGAHIGDNVEVYAGSPVFALANDDTLTGSAQADTFVFAQPIGNDTVHDFDAAHDVVDLVGFSVTSFADLAIAQADGNAVVTVGAGTITLVGVDAAQLSAANFAFDQEPVTHNSGTMAIGSGAILPLGGTVENSGAITLSAGGDVSTLEVLAHGMTLTGGGQVTLSDDAANVITGTEAGVVLDNVDNVISGAGQIGAGALTLHNEGTITATGTNPLVIDTGANAILSSGTLETDGGTLILQGAVTGGGNAIINGGTMEFADASDANVSFAAGNAGTLQLDHAALFSGQVTGVAAGDAFDFRDMAFGSSTTLNFVGDMSAGSLTVGSAAATATVKLVGDATGFSFVTANDGHGGTLVTATATPTGGSGSDVLVANVAGVTLTGNGGADTFVFAKGFANGDTITDVSSGDHFVFTGFGTEATGASFTQADATHWSINSADGLTHEIIALQNGAVPHVGDWHLA